MIETAPDPRMLPVKTKFGEMMDQFVKPQSLKVFKLFFTRKLPVFSIYKK